MSGWNEDGSWWKLLHQDDQKAEVELPHRRRKFELEDKKHPESGGLSRKLITFAGVRVGKPANTEGMNEGGRELEVQRKLRKKMKVKATETEQMKKFRNPNAGGCETEPTSIRDSLECDHHGRANNSYRKTGGGQ
ncbi:hypothetical protein K438DRAFT_1783335 [Mycena galopus ATCC 62051]|nr:hypothetical protein K438DRAFT_1783335 [Mycena galopus ATCC 62051]